MSSNVVNFEIQKEVDPWDDIWYETSDTGGRFWQRSGDRYISRSERQIVRHLKAMGLRGSLTMDELKVGETMSEIDVALHKIENKQVVDMAGAFAGWHAGFRFISGRPVLVTESAKLVVPSAPGEDANKLPEPVAIGEHCAGWPSLGHYFNTRFGTDRVESFNQMSTFCQVIKRAYLAISDGQPKRCQAMVFAGDPGCGKTLLFSIMKEIFGGKVARPLRYLMGRTEFNKQMYYAPLLLVDDEGADTHIAQRKVLSANVKQIVAAEGGSCHGKGKDEFEMQTQRLLCFAVNMEEDNLMVLPPMDEDVEGKIHLFRFYSGEWPWDPRLEEEKIWEIVSQELPFFINWLINEYEVPGNLYEQRFGVMPFHHIEVLEGLDFLSPEARLLNWIDRTVLHPEKNPSGVWEGTATKLEEEFRAVDSPLSLTEKDKIPAANPTLGKQLNKLSRKPQHAGRITAKREGGSGQRLWILVSQDELDRKKSAQSEQEEVEL